MMVSSSQGSQEPTDSGSLETVKPTGQGSQQSSTKVKARSRTQSRTCRVKPTGQGSQKSSTKVKAKSKSPSPVACGMCGKDAASEGALRNHKCEYHDGDRLRDNPLRCKWCDTTVGMTRKGLLKHMTSCVEVSKEQFPISCPYCSFVCESLMDLGDHANDCESWEEDTSNDFKISEEFDKQLVRITRHPETSEWLKRLFVTAQVSLPDGTTEMALLVPNRNKKLRTGSNARVRILDLREPSVHEEVSAVKTKLDAVLESHSYGRLVNLPDYMLLDKNDPVWHLPFPGNGERLATMLEGLIIHSEVDVLLVLKLEIYGTADHEDVHTQDIARPQGTRSFEVVNVNHDSTHKVMIGTIKWCALITLAVMLTDGTIIVGPNNKIFQPRSSSCIWIKRNPGRFVYNTMPRQLRSKFYEESTFACYAAVHPLLNHHSTMPATLQTLIGFKINNGWSGIKVAAFVFHQLYSQRKIVKSDVLYRLQEALDRKGKPCELLNVVQNMTSEMRDEEVFPVSTSVNRSLTEIAGRLSSVISDLNKTEVLLAVEKKIKGMLAKKK